MDASEQKTEKTEQCCRPAAFLKGLSLAFAFFLFSSMALALGTFLVPMSSYLNLFICFLAAGLLTAWFSRRALSCREAKEGEPARRGHGSVIGSLAGLTLLCVCVLSLVSAHWRSQSEAAKRMLAFRGFPVSMAEFQENVPEGRYAYPKLSKAIENDFDPAFYNKGKHADGGISKWTPETAKQEAPVSAHYGPYLEKTLAPLLKQKYDRYMKVDYLQAAQEPLKTPVPPKLGNLSTIAKLAKIQAVSLALKGETEKAWSMVRLQFALAELLGGERSILGKMVIVAIRGQAADAAAGVLLSRPGTVLPKDLLLRLQAASDSGLAAEGLRGELAYQYDIYNMVGRMNYRTFTELGGFSGFVLSGPGSSPGGGSRRDYFLFSLLRRMGLVHMNAMASAGYFSTVGEPGTWEQVSQRGREAEARVNNLPAWPFLFVKFSLPSFSLQSREFEVQARARMAVALAELRRFRQERGKYPKALSELKSKIISPDIFTGKDFIYEPAAGGFDLCSAGPAGDRTESSGKDFCIRQRP